MGDMAELYDYMDHADDRPPPMAPGEPCPGVDDACDGTMVERRNRKDGSRFVGCSRYPRCRHTAPLEVNV